MAGKYAIDFYFDVISPYSFIGFESLLRYRTKWSMDVKLKPFCLGHVMKMANNKPPALACPAKAPYLGRDVTRLAKYYDIPLKFPKNFIEVITTKSTLNADRLLLAVMIEQPEKTEAVARALFRRFWVEENGIFDTEDFKQVLESCKMSNVDKLISMIGSEEVKQKLRQHNEDAVNDGCFGAPWTVLHHPDGRSDAFFGSDRLHIIGSIMGQTFEGPLSSKI